MRQFSYRENARIQTFPDDWEFEGNLSSKYRQIGNAVPVSLAKEIGLKIAECLGAMAYGKKAGSPEQQSARHSGDC